MIGMLDLVILFIFLKYLFNKKDVLKNYNNTLISKLQINTMP